MNTRLDLKWLLRLDRFQNEAVELQTALGTYNERAIRINSR